MSTVAMLRRDLAMMLPTMPRMCSAVLTRRRYMSWADLGHSAMQAVLSCVEMGIMLAALPMYLMLPGVMFAMWMGGCALVVMAMCWLMNDSSAETHHCMAGCDGNAPDDEKWLFMSGMGISSRHCHSHTLPTLSRLFARPVTCVCTPTYGLPLDMLAMVLQRCGLPAILSADRPRRALYAQLRTALLDDAKTRCVVLAHNHAAVTVSRVVASLCSDLPADKLSKLEVYTFGSAACEFMLPLGESVMHGNSSTSNQSMLLHSSAPNSPSSPSSPTTSLKNPAVPAIGSVHIEHFAMTNDPFAQMGVLRAVRGGTDSDAGMMGESRYCGGVFAINADMSMSLSAATHTSSPAAAGSSSNTKMSMMIKMLGSSAGLMMEDYLLALFPAQLMAMSSSRRDQPQQQQQPPQRVQSVLDSVMHIDRACAEKREIAAISLYNAQVMRSKTSHPNGAAAAAAGAGGGGQMKKRLSWTALGAMSPGAGNGQQKNGMNAGMVGLEMARRGCKNCDGHRGREVSWLGRYAMPSGVMMATATATATTAPGMSMGVHSLDRNGVPVSMMMAMDQWGPTGSGGVMNGNGINMRRQ